MLGEGEEPFLQEGEGGMLGEGEEPFLPHPVRMREREHVGNDDRHLVVSSK